MRQPEGNLPVPGTQRRYSIDPHQRYTHVRTKNESRALPRGHLPSHSSCRLHAAVDVPGGCQFENGDDAPIAEFVEEEATNLSNERRGIGVEGLGESLGHEEQRQSDELGTVSQSLLVGDQDISIDARKSLFVTDTAILASFPLSRVMNQLATQGGGGQSGLTLFRKWWDTQNATGTVGPIHCVSTLDSFPYQCPREEGQQAFEDPFAGPTEQQYKPVALVNRFDLAPSSGKDCGEYRIIYMRRSGEVSPGPRGSIIFEAVLPNPNPATGLAGCRPVQEMWAQLSLPGRSDADRAASLSSFFFTGLPTFLPVVHVDNYGGSTNNRATGQVRTNQFQQAPWMLREFKIRRVSGAARFDMVVNRTNPAEELFSPTSTHARKGNFDNFFATQVANLARDDVNKFSMANSTSAFGFNSGDSVSGGGNVSPHSYRTRFGSGPSALRTKIQTELTKINSSLTPDDIVARAEALSCSGCHRTANGVNLGGGMTFPSADNFTHVSEQLEAGTNIERFRISAALTNTFLPHRKALMEAFITSSDTAPMCSGSPGGFEGCRGTGCNVCAEKTGSFPYYFANHPKCVKNTTCEGSFFTCNVNCPAPTNADKAPLAGTCGGSTGQWSGCSGNGCAACTTLLVNFPKYFANHPRCVANTSCTGATIKCNDNCPAPTDADK